MSGQYCTCVKYTLHTLLQQNIFYIVVRFSKRQVSEERLESYLDLLQVCFPARKVSCMKKSYYENFIHENLISMYENEISIHENENSTHEIFMPRFFMYETFVRI